MASDYACQGALPPLPDGTLHFYADSDGRIVKGLLAIVLTAVEGKNALELRQKDPLALFCQLGLEAELGASRADGLAAIVSPPRAAPRASIMLAGTFLDGGRRDAYCRRALASIFSACAQRRQSQRSRSPWSRRQNPTRSPCA